MALIRLLNQGHFFYYFDKEKGKKTARKVQNCELPCVLIRDMLYCMSIEGGILPFCGYGIIMTGTAVSKQYESC